MRIRKESFAFLLVMRSGKQSCGRRAFVTIVSALLTAIIVTAVPTSTTGQSENKDQVVENEGHSISGRLLDKPGGKGVGGVVVGGPWGTGSAKAADDGTYSISGVAAAGHWLTPERRTGVWTDWVMVDVKDKDITDKQVYMTLPQSISGTARDARSLKPVPNATVRISVDTNWDEIRTDAEGKYLLYVRPREVTFICSGAPGYCALDENGKETASLEKKIAVGVGDKIERVDFKLKWAPVFWGHVVYPDGRPASDLAVDAWVSYAHRGTWGAMRGGGPFEGSRFIVKTDAEGKFAAGSLVNGRMPGLLREPRILQIAQEVHRENGLKDKLERFSELLKEEGSILTSLEGVVVVPDRSMGVGFRAKPDRSGQKFEPLNLVLGPCGKVTVRVLDPNGEPLDGVWVSASWNSEPSRYWPSWNGEVEYLGEGKYVMSKLIPGVRYHLNAHTPAEIGHTEEFILKPGEARDVNTVTVRWTEQESVAELVKEVKNGKSARGAYERQIAAYLLGQMGSEAKMAVPELVAQLKIDIGDTDNRYRIVEALGRIGDPRALDVLREALKDENENVRNAAAEAIQRIDEAQKAGSGDTKKVREEVSAHQWQRERVENIAGETIEQTIENLANFDDCHFAVTGTSAAPILGKLDFEVEYVIALFRVRRLWRRS